MLGGYGVQSSGCGRCYAAHVDDSPHCRSGRRTRCRLYRDAFGAEEVSRIRFLMDG
jgi:hypothetical protein